MQAKDTRTPMKPKLRRKTGQPLYVQLADQLRKELDGIGPGQRFHGDHELCAKFGVSQPVARAAMELLVVEGRVHRIRARGTFTGPRVVQFGAPGTQVAVLSPLNPYRPHAKALAGFAQVARTRGIEVVFREIPAVRYQRKAMLESLAELREKVLGIAWISPFMEEDWNPPDMPDGLARQLVLINMRMMSDNVTCVLPDYLSGAYNVMTHLIALGHKRIAYIGGPRDRPYACLRLEAYRKAMQIHNLPVTREFVREHVADERLADDAYAATRAMLSRGQPPDAIFGATDVHAHYIMAAIRDAGLRIPEDIAVAGFDDLLSAAQERPPLTTAHQPYHEMGIEAAHLLFEQLEGMRQPGGVHLAPCPLVIRESCGNRLQVNSRKGKK